MPLSSKIRERHRDTADATSELRTSKHGTHLCGVQESTMGGRDRGGAGLRKVSIADANFTILGQSRFKVA